MPRFRVQYRSIGHDGPLVANVTADRIWEQGASEVTFASKANDGGHLVIAHFENIEAVWLDGTVEVETSTRRPQRIEDAGSAR